MDIQHVRRLEIQAIVALLVLFLAASWFALTSSKPTIPTPPLPTAKEVRAAQGAFQQLQDAKKTAVANRITLSRSELSSIAVLASHALGPDRIKLSPEGKNLRIRVSHLFRIGRWVNITVLVGGPSEGFPPARMSIGAIKLSPALSRWALEGVHWLYEVRYGELPPLDSMVRRFLVDNGRVSAVVNIRGSELILDQLADGQRTARIYCHLVRLNRSHPSTDLVEQIRRAFSMTADDSKQVNFNIAAFTALGMLVDNRLADVVPSAKQQSKNCLIAPLPVTIHGRTDLAKHWTVSAVLSISGSQQISQAAGEWKELADSLERKPKLGIGDPSGFSLADLAANRSGFHVARAAVQPEKAKRIAKRLSTTMAAQLIPLELVNRQDGLGNSEFVYRFGGLDDERYQTRVQEIDRVLHRSGIR